MMRRYGQRHMVVLLCGAALTVAAAMLAMWNQYGIALAVVSLLLGLSLAVALDTRQRLRHVGQSLARMDSRLDAVNTRLVALMETERTDAVDRHAETMAKLEHLAGTLPERS